MHLECYNHYPAPIAFEQKSLLPGIRWVYNQLIERNLVLPTAHFPHFETIEFNLIDNTTIQELHAQYMDDPTPTDVITFHHGEVFISYDTAVSESSSRHLSLEEELFRYHVHGLLHLAGYDDLEEADYQSMHELQESFISEWDDRQK